MPDVRILAPPVANRSHSTKQKVSEEYFHIMVSGVILLSLGRIETGLDSNLKGSLGTPPLSVVSHSMSSHEVLQEIGKCLRKKL